MCIFFRKKWKKNNVTRTNYVIDYLLLLIVSFCFDECWWLISNQHSSTLINVCLLSKHRFHSSFSYTKPLNQKKILSLFVERRPSPKGILTTRMAGEGERYSKNIIRYLPDTFYGHCRHEKWLRNMTGSVQYSILRISWRIFLLGARPPPLNPELCAVNWP